MSHNQSKTWDPNFPFPPSKSPIYYGWVVLVAATLGILCSVPGQTIGVSVFTDALIEHLGLSRVDLSLAYLLGTTASGFLLPWVGRLFDRVGARRMAVGAGVFLALTLGYFAGCDLLASGLQAGGLVWESAFAVITLGFFLLRFFGQGMLTLTSRNMLGKWFDRKRGRAMAISGVFVTIAFSLAPIMFDLLIERLGWRGAYLALAATVLTVMTIVGYVLFRDNPEECGLQMDGDQTDTAPTVDRHPDQVIHREMTLQEASRTFSFWIFNAALCFSALFTTAYAFHVVSIGASVGLDKSTILGLFIPIAIFGVGFNFLSGWMADRTRMRYVLLLFCLGLSSTGGGLLLFPSTLGQILVIAGMSVAMGCFQTIMGVVWPRFYGRRHVGAISGFNMSAIVLGSAVGPYLFSLADFYAASYRPAFWGGLIFPLILAAASPFSNNPQAKLTDQ